jgi:hypothetical protein
MAEYALSTYLDTFAQVTQGFIATPSKYSKNELVALRHTWARSRPIRRRASRADSFFRETQGREGRSRKRHGVKRMAMAIQIGDTAPAFRAHTTEEPIGFHGRPELGGAILKSATHTTA